MARDQGPQSPKTLKTKAKKVRFVSFCALSKSKKLVFKGSNFGAIREQSIVFLNAKKKIY